MRVFPLAALALLAVAFHAEPVEAQDYYTDVRPVLVQNCTGCHRADGVSWSMEDAEHTYSRRRAIGRAVLARKMPPWLAEAGHQEYVDDLSLTDAHLEMVSAWVDAGYPLGEPRPDPRSQSQTAAPSFAADLSLDVLGGGSYLPNQDRTDDYRCFVVDWPGTEETYVTGFRTRPGNRGVAHHVVVYAVTPDMADRFRELPSFEEGQGYQCFGGAEPDRLFDEQQRAAYEETHPDGLRQLARNNFWLAHWAPGMDGYAFPEGTGVRLQPGSLLVVQMHYYSAHAPGESDRGSMMDFTVAEQVERPAFHYPLTEGRWLAARRNGSLVVPPEGTATVEVTETLGDLGRYVAAVTGVPQEEVEALEVHSANLHMHAIGASGVITLKDGEQPAETLLSVPEWDLAWQRDFTFKQPKVFDREQLPQTRLTVRCTYQNPTADTVYGGYGSDEEMCFNFSYIAVRRAERNAASPR